jgi:hypothetical protein
MHNLPHPTHPAMKVVSHRIVTVQVYLPGTGILKTIPPGTSGNWADFGVLSPMSVEPMSQSVTACNENSLAWQDPGHFPNLFCDAVWTPKNWPDFDGQSFYGWRFENRDQNLNRMLQGQISYAATLGAKQSVMATIPFLGSCVGQPTNALPFVQIAMAASVANAGKIEFRSLTSSGNWGTAVPADLSVTQVDNGAGGRVAYDIECLTATWWAARITIT